MLDYEHDWRRAQCLSEAETSAVDNVPPILRRLHPRLTADEFARFQNDIAFLHRAVQVCESCYLRFTKPQLGIASTALCRNAQWRSVGDGRVSTSPDAGVTPEDQDLSDYETCGSRTMRRTKPGHHLKAPQQAVKELDPEPLRWRRDATLQRIGDLRAAEESEEFHELQEWREAQDFQRLLETQRRAKSWSRLTSDGAGGQQPVKPKYLSASRPSPPEGAAPFWGTVRLLSQDNEMKQTERQALRRVPQLRGEPYLREVRAFAAHHGSRAPEVLGAAALEAATQAADRMLRRSVSAGAIRSTSAGTIRTQRPHAEFEARQRHRDPELDLASLGGESDEVHDVASEGDPVVAELCRTWGRGGHTPTTGLPTTATPSQADVPSSGVSPHHWSRPSTRASSRGLPGMCAASAAMRHQHVQSRPTSRPRSSPQVGGGRNVRSPQPRNILQRRPASSPETQNPGLRHAISLRTQTSGQ